MDLITQGILGAAVGQAGFQHKLGRKAVLWGALYGMAPDLDVIVKFSSNPFSEQLYHRGFTHSLFFAPIVAPIAAYVMQRFSKNKDYWAWMWLTFWALITHPLLDLFTHYGTQLLNPLSNYRFSLAAIPVIDLLYSVPLLASVILGLFLSKDRLVRTITSIMLLLTTCYLFYGIVCNSSALDQARKDLGATACRIESYPTMFQIHLRRVVVHLPGEVKIGLVSTYPGAAYPIKWFSYRSDAGLGIDAFLKTPEAKIYTWFCADDYLIQRSADYLKLYDLRFGMPGSAEPGIWGLELKKNGQPQAFRSSYSSLYRGPFLSWITDVMVTSFGKDPAHLVENYNHD